MPIQQIKEIKQKNNFKNKAWRISLNKFKKFDTRKLKGIFLINSTEPSQLKNLKFNPNKNLQHSLSDYFLINADLLFADRQNILFNNHVMFINVLDSCHAALIIVISENEFDKAFRNCKLIKIINDINLNLQDNMQYFNTAEDAVHQYDNDFIIRNSFSLFIFEILVTSLL